MTTEKKPRKYGGQGRPWLEARAFYVEGEAGQGDDAPHHWPTLEEVAKRFSFSHDHVRTRAGKEGWSQERRLFAQRWEEARRTARANKLAGDAVKFDGTTLRLAQALVGEVAQAVRDIQKVRQLRDMKAREAEGDDEALAKVLSDPCLRPVAPGQLLALSTALANAQRVGRQALGDPTEIVKMTAETTAQVSAEVAVSGAVEVSGAMDFRADPRMIAEVARVLKASGIEGDAANG